MTEFQVYYFTKQHSIIFVIFCTFRLFSFPRLILYYLLAFYATKYRRIRSRELFIDSYSVVSLTYTTV